ncbi:MAG: cell envelope integrity protein TolA [Methylococcales bacterium]|nr:cell envelope integrity protein TolA [Methylococcales bacterium]
MGNQKRFTWPVLLALALHFTLLGLFILSALYKPSVKEVDALPEVIHATMIDTASLQKEAEAIKQSEAKQEQLIKEQLESKEKAEKEIKQAEIEEAAAEAKAEAAKAAKAEAAKQAKAEAAAKAEVAAKAEAEAATQAKLAAQALAEQQAKQAIQQKVNRSWIRPVSAEAGLKCTIRVKLMSDGTVIDAEVISSSGDEIFDRSAENAVNKASPLPVPKDKELFAREFRAFEFLFNPK